MVPCELRVPLSSKAKVLIVGYIFLVISHVASIFSFDDADICNLFRLLDHSALWFLKNMIPCLNKLANFLFIAKD